MTETNRIEPLHERYDWLDQARGLIVLMLLISMSTDHFAGNVLMDDRPLGPTLLNHGYEYFDGAPAIITFIDAGQALFMFVMGFVGYSAFISRLKKRGGHSAFWYAVRRVGVLYALAFMESVVLNSLIQDGPKWGDFLYDSTFTMLALGTLAGFSCIVVCPSADRRIFISLALTLVHSVLYAYPVFDHYTGDDNVMHLLPFPFGVLGMCAVAIAGTCFGQWYRMDVDDPATGFRERIMPAATIAVISAYCLDWIQPPEHHDATASLQLLAIAIGGFTLMIFYAFGRVGFRFRLLSCLGKNLLIMFAMGGILVDTYLDLLPKSVLLEWPPLALVLVGIAPIVALSGVAVVLEKRGIMVRA